MKVLPESASPLTPLACTGVKGTCQEKARVLLVPALHRTQSINTSVRHPLLWRRVTAASGLSLPCMHQAGSKMKLINALFSTLLLAAIPCWNVGMRAGVHKPSHVPQDPSRDGMSSRA